MGKANRELFEKKQELKKEWEDCFEKAMESSFTSMGLAKFWSDETSVREAEAMLMGAAINDFLGEIVEHIEGIAVVHLGSENDEPCKGDCNCECKEEDMFQVYNKVTKDFYEEIFSTVEDAKYFVEQEALNTSYKVDDLKVVRVYD